MLSNLNTSEFPWCPSSLLYPTVSSLSPSSHLASSNLVPSSSHLHNNSQPAVSPCRSTSGISSTNHQERSTSGSDWTQVKGRSTGSWGLRLTAPYRLRDPQMTANAKKYYQITLFSISRRFYDLNSKLKYIFLHSWDYVFPI